jgi:ribosomal protein S6
MFLLDDARCSENYGAATREVTNILEKNHAEVFSTEKWDERKLCYPIEGHMRAVYFLVRFTGPGDALGHIERDCQLNDTILRVLIIRDTHSEKLHKAGLLALRPGDPGEPIQSLTKRAAAAKSVVEADGPPPRREPAGDDTGGRGDRPRAE